MAAVVFPDNLLEKLPFRAGFLVPNDHLVRALAWRGTSGRKQPQPARQQ
jgi:hypothetical protein